VALNSRLILIAEDYPHAQEARNRLARVGLARVIGYALADENEWQKAGLAIGRVSIERCELIRHTGFLAAHRRPQQG
jgi:hypothetical protein